MTDRWDDSTAREEVLFEIIGAFEEAARTGHAPDRQSFLSAHPEFARELAEYLDAQESLLRLTEPLRQIVRAAVLDAPTSTLTETHLASGGLIGDFADYEVIEEIARGGMGVVYRGRQISLNRPVALKLILAGSLASEAELRRFRDEAEAVALLDHPHIVPIFSVGEHEGQPYLAMKLIEGGSLADRLKKSPADPRDAANLTAAVARAVHHAHQRGVLHRDLKPSNILVDREGQPHVTDFGLAKRVEGSVELTQSGAILGSPPYMSPEQTTGHRGAITTATDVYGLGAVLYALLTGRPPFRADSALETIDQVRHCSPEPPSGINHRVNRDLQTICLKCLDKDPRRRYASALDLAEDLDRWLEGRPILARRVGPAEKAWRWARRNPLVAGLSALVLLLMMSGVIGLAQSNRIISRRNVVVEQERDKARIAQKATKKALDESEESRDKTTRAELATRKALEKSEESREEAEATSRFMIDAFRRPDPSVDGRELKVVDLLANAAARLDANSAIPQRIKANLFHNLGWTFSGLGLPAQAVEMNEKASEIVEGSLGPDHLITLTSLNNLATAYVSAGRAAEAIPLLERVLRAGERVLGPDHPQTLKSSSNLATAYLEAGRAAEAIPLLERVLREGERVLGPDHPVTLTIRSNLGGAYSETGRTAEAIPLLERVLREGERVLGPDHPDTLATRSKLGVAYREAGRTAEAIPLLERVLRERERVLGPDHPGTMTSRGDLGVAYIQAGRVADSIPLLERVLRDQERVLGPDHLQTLKSRGNLATAYLEAGRTAEAIPLLERVLRERERVLGPDHRGILATRGNLGEAYRKAGRIAEAIPLLERVMRESERVLGPDHPQTLTSRNNLATAYLSAGRAAEALTLHERVLRDQERVLGHDHPDTLKSLNNLATAYHVAGRTADSIPLHERVLRERERVLGPDHPDTLISRGNVATAYHLAGRIAEALPRYERALSEQERVLGPDHPNTLTIRNNLAGAYDAAGSYSRSEPLHRVTLERMLKSFRPGDPRIANSMAPLGNTLLKQGKWGEAEAILRQCLAIREKTQPTVWSTFNTRSQLGDCLLGLGKFSEAESLIVSGYEGLKTREEKIPREARARLSEAAERIVRLYETWDRPEQAREWKARLGLSDLPADVFARP